MWTRKGRKYSFLNVFGTVASLQRTNGPGWACLLGSIAGRRGLLMRLDIIAISDHIANGSGRAKRG
jgi:hypothetical protein